MQRRIAVAAATACKLGRHRLAELLDAEIVHYRERAEPLAVAYAEVGDALRENPSLTLAQIKRWLAQVYGLQVGEVGKVFRGLGTVYKMAQKEALEMRHRGHPERIEVRPHPPDRAQQDQAAAN